MIEPTGPLPPSVYRRRRVAAIVALVAAVALLVLTIDGLVGGDDSGQVRNVAGSDGDTVLRSTPPPMTRPSPGGSTTTSPTGTTSPAAESGTPSTSSSTTQPPSPPKPCPDDAIVVRADTGKPSYRVGEQPLLKLVVINVGEQPCVRDLSRKLRELVITRKSDGKRLWSSNDCYSPPGKDVRTLRPAKRLTFTLNWAGRTSAPGCPVERETVPAGEYLVTGKLGKLTGEAVPLRLRP